VNYGLTDYRGAIASCKTALDIDGRHAEAWHIRAISEDKLQMFQSAAQSYKEYLDCLPKPLPQNEPTVQRAFERLDELSKLPK